MQVYTKNFKPRFASLSEIVWKMNRAINESFIRRTSVSIWRVREYKLNVRNSQSHNERRQKQPIRTLTITETFLRLKNIRETRNHPADDTISNFQYSILVEWLPLPAENSTAAMIFEVWIDWKNG